MTQWASDTCNCIIQFDDKTLKITKFVRRCKNSSGNIGDDFVSYVCIVNNQNINQANPVAVDGTGMDKLTSAKQASFTASV